MTYVTENPATGTIERTFPTMSDAEVEDVLARSAAAYREWKTTPIDDRVRMLRATAQIYRDRAQELAGVIATEMGKPINQGMGELALTAMIYDWYAEHGPALLETEELDPQGAASSTVTREPVGPLLGIMPWNFPYYQVARFAAPNLLLGNTIVLKHAPICAASSALMEQIAHDAGVPKDAYINVYASNEQAATMIADKRIQGVSLTGSGRAGAAVAQTAAQHLKKSVLELGGSDAFILLDTPDVSATAAGAAAGRMMNCGQACNSPKRFIVHEDLYDDFVAALTETVSSMTVGDPTDPATRVGPLSSVAARDTVVQQVAEAVAQGATLHTGGQALDRPGAFMAPAVLTGVTPEMNAYREEVFGPVAMVFSVSDDDQAVDLANDVDYGLSGSVWSTDVERASAVADRLDVGMAMVNEHGTSLPGLPFGGVKASGYGRELGPWGLGEFANLRLRRVAK
ncbi:MULTISPECIES: NAD-dependent succinate-semialdehyde dehydrogenase [unclassified Gordonia (in: high G+C Gram-positive bacteria)]|uniref:NAD-dependent succinate-semialdehyde dehydrogenase n=1 Tax=unclassified Gordonia (in: high G+C Gram-positive bacteria) TaxID=2657482 RepID=UPI001FFED431|nr:MULTISPECIES: NAD-dependent succinate-semialdehyde dehydrogenase [unclassified Gordonia (in: high G+C Gram-positive bacteria)]UQE74082.1 NAD-dependent succinate-semialdehyde dehydrogenase [Gordonia sp. PP30]